MSIVGIPISQATKTGMTRLQLRTMVIANVKRTDKDSVINAALDMALSRIQNANRWSFFNKASTLTLALGGSTAALPTDCGHVMAMTLVDGAYAHGLLGIGVDNFKSTFPLTTTPTTGLPEVYCIDNRVIRFDKQATKAYTLNIDYMIEDDFPTDTTASPSTLIDEALIAYATYYVFMSIQDFVDAQQWKALYREALQEAINADRREGTVVHTLPTMRLVDSMDSDNTISLIGPFTPGA